LRCEALRLLRMLDLRPGGLRLLRMLDLRLRDLRLGDLRLGDLRLRDFFGILYRSIFSNRKILTYFNPGSIIIS
jgi:hypothetical protein